MSAKTVDGRLFKSPIFEDDLTAEDAHERLTDAILSGDLPEWLRGKVDAEDLNVWAVHPRQGHGQRKSRNAKGAVRQRVALWPDSALGFVVTPVDGPHERNLTSHAATEEEALNKMAQMLDSLRNQRFEFKSNLPPEVLESLSTRPDEKLGVRYFVIELERGNRSWPSRTSMASPSTGSPAVASGAR